MTLHMRWKYLFKRVSFDRTAHHFGQLSIAIKQQKGDMRNAVARSKQVAVSGFYISNQKLVAVVIICLHRAAGLLLQRRTQTARRVMDLHNGALAPRLHSFSPPRVFWILLCSSDVLPSFVSYAQPACSLHNHDAVNSCFPSSTASNSTT